MHSWSAILRSLPVPLLVLLQHCSADAEESPARRGATGTSAAVALLEDATAALGLPSTAPLPPDGTYRLHEIMGPGVGLFDGDGDGDLDLIEVVGRPPGEDSAPAPDRYWRQEEDGTFRDATAASGLGEPGDGQGVACGDADNDGDVDVYFTQYGPDAFYRNEGAGRFAERTAAAGLGNERWACSAAFFDAEADGDLDLFVVNYVQYDPEKACYRKNSEPEYCGPLEYGPILDVFYRNQGDGTYVDATRAAGIGVPGTGLGILCADLSGDGRVDVYVANDAQANHLWVARPDGSFREEGCMRGIALNRHGKPEASMGVAAGDSDADGALELFLSHLEGENNTLYTPSERFLYEDATVATGLSRHDLPFTGFGCGFFDLELDGDLDLAVVNGRVKSGPLHPGAALGRFWSAYAEPDFLFVNDGRGRFVSAGEQAGEFGRVPRISRGLAFGDLEGDGDVDLVESCYGSPLVLWRNVAERQGHWLRVRPRTCGREALGAQVRVEAGGRSFVGLCLAAYSYASSSEPVVHFGLGPAERVDSVEVVWPDGAVERFDGGAADREIVLVQGTGEGT